MYTIIHMYDVQSIDFSKWLQTHVTEEDYVMCKIDVLKVPKI